MPNPGRPCNYATFEAVRSSIGDAGVVDLLTVVAYCHGLGPRIAGIASGAAGRNGGSADLLSRRQ